MGIHCLNVSRSNRKYSRFEACAGVINTSAEFCQLFRRPLVFVCHGLGGILVKRVHRPLLRHASILINMRQAMISLYDTYLPPGRRHIRDVHSGTIFIGTPHPTYAKRSEWFKLNLVLRAGLKLSRIRLAHAELEAATVANISRRLEQSRIDEPILSFCEKRKTKIYGRFFVSEKHVVSYRIRLV